MEILPSEYQQIELSRSEKIFVRNVMGSERYGYLLIKTNPAMLKNESMHTLECVSKSIPTRIMQEVCEYRLNG